MRLFKKKKKDGCNHCITSESNTLERISIFKMTNPQKKYYKCKKCNKIFEFAEDSKTP